MKPLRTRQAAFARSCVVLLAVGLIQGAQVPPSQADGIGQPVAGLRLTVACPTSPIAAGEPVEMVVAIENRSAKGREIIETWPERDVRLRVTDADGKPISLTRLGARYEHRNEWSYTGRVRMPLGPGEERSYRLNPAAFYDLTLPGKYRIAASVRVPEEDSRDLAAIVPLDSGEIAVEIAPLRSAPAATTKPSR